MTDPATRQYAADRLASSTSRLHRADTDLRTAADTLGDTAAAAEAYLKARREHQQAIADAEQAFSVE